MGLIAAASETKNCNDLHKAAVVTAMNTNNRDVSSCDYALTSRGYSLISKTVYGSYLEESWILRCPGVQLYTVNNTETANNLF